MSVMKAYGVVTLGKPGDLSIGNSEWSYLVALHTSLASDQKHIIQRSKLVGHTSGSSFNTKKAQLKQT